MTLHSFGILAYKDSPYLPECIESLINQTVKSRIFISTSTPSEYISSLAKKYNLELFITEKGRGAVHDNNFAFRNVKTKYVTMAHQDDIYMPDYTETCLAQAEKFNDSLICFTNYSEIMDGKDRKVNLSLKIKRFMLWFFMPFSSYLKRKFWKKKLLSFGNPIAAPSVMYNLEKLPGFQFPIESAHKVNTIDWETWYDLATRNGQFIYAKKILLKRRIHKDSLTSLGLEDNSRYIEDLNMFKRFWPLPIANMLANIYKSAYKSNQN